VRDTIFISYCHANRKWLTVLRNTLKPALKSRSVKAWADTDIKPGAKWRAEIEDALGAAKVAVLLVTTDYLASEFIADNELPPILSAAEHDGLTILWVYIGACLYTHTVIAEYQAAHDISRPLNILTPARRELALVAIANRIIEAADGVTSGDRLFATRRLEDLPQPFER
jgi:hypothetical protein